MAQQGSQSRQNNVMSPVELGTKNQCAGEDQQQFSSQAKLQNFQLI
jgi:hypothetical protein